jgi:hypothetical protein
MLKLTRHLFSWETKAKYADYYERALFNGILPTQDPATAMMMYYVPMMPGMFKTFMKPFDSFWCCTGTGMENHAKYGDSIYFHDENGVFVNLFIASELLWPEKGFGLRQETRFPEEGKTTLVVTAAGPGETALRIRIPAVLYGPIVLAGELGPVNMPDDKVFGSYGPSGDPVAVPKLAVKSADPSTWIKPVPSKPLTFRTENVGVPTDITLVPFYKLFGQRYTVYWDFTPESKKKESSS